MFFSMKKKKETFAKVVTGHLTQEKAGERLSESFLTIKYGDHSRALRKRVLWSLTRSIEKHTIGLAGILFRNPQPRKPSQVSIGKKPFAILR
tara:strand:+ start:2734 stop:3009 length:276 start_codon:yes stop_codon:yes gene_type:complete